VVEGNYKRDEVVGNIRSLVERARAQNVPVVWVQDTGENRKPGSEPWQIVAELSPADEEA
jgi:nicotinamidase-related amidase